MGKMRKHWTGWKKGGEKSMESPSEVRNAQAQRRGAVMPETREALGSRWEEPEARWGRSELDRLPHPLLLRQSLICTYPECSSEKHIL